MKKRAALLLGPCLLLACESAPAPGPEASSKAPGASQAQSQAQSQSAPRPGASTTAQSSSALAISSAKPDAPPPTQDEIDAGTRFAKANNAFGFDIYGEMRKTPGNLAMSPTSLSIALAMTWAGAKGQTAAEMKKVLHFAGGPADTASDAGKLTKLLENPSRPLQIAIANRLFGEKTYSFEKPYLDSTEKSFGAGMEALDFAKASEASRNTINQWVEQKTEKRITNLLPSGAIDGATRLVLVNAVYFLAEWQRPFDRNSTRPADFAVTASKRVQAPMMHQQGMFNHSVSDGITLLDLPYKGGEMSMMIAMPSEPEGLDKLEASLGPQKLAAWQKTMKPGPIVLGMPKFEVNPAAATNVGDALQKLGMKSAFDPATADFTSIAKTGPDGKPLGISDVFHKAFVKVDEKGTEAAAASAVTMRNLEKSVPPPPPPKLDIDKPFVYLIRDNTTNLVLFIGRVADPTVK